MINGDGINTIFFDLDGTLRHNRPTFLEALSKYTRELGLNGAADEHRQAFRWLYHYWAQSPELVKNREIFGDNEDLFWINHSRLYLTAYGCGSEQAVRFAPSLTQCMRESYNPEDILGEKVPELLEGLKSSGYRLGVISNRRNPFDEQLESLGIDSYFEYSLAAGTIKAWKPEPEIFQHALASMEIAPEEAVYVGDNYFADVIGAQEAGLQPVLIDPEGLFPEADCPVIHKISELESVLKQ